VGAELRDYNPSYLGGGDRGALETKSSRPAWQLNETPFQKEKQAFFFKEKEIHNLKKSNTIVTFKNKPIQTL
jgi:hypothetical protein